MRMKVADRLGPEDPSKPQQLP